MNTDPYKSDPVIPAKAGIPFPWGKVGWGSHVPYGTVLWVPACAGTTAGVLPTLNSNLFLVTCAHLKAGLVLLVQLRDQACFPRQILLHRLAIAQVPIVHEKQIIDALGVRRDLW